MAYCIDVSQDHEEHTARCRTTSFAAFQGTSFARCSVKLSNTSDMAGGVVDGL